MRFNRVVGVSFVGAFSVVFAVLALVVLQDSALMFTEGSVFRPREQVVEAELDRPVTARRRQARRSRPATQQASRRMRAAARPGGLLVDGQGEPIAGVDLVVSRADADERPLEVRTAEDGRFTLALELGSEVSFALRSQAWLLRPPAAVEASGSVSVAADMLLVAEETGSLICVRDEAGGPEFWVRAVAADAGAVSGGWQRSVEGVASLQVAPGTYYIAQKSERDAVPLVLEDSDGWTRFASVTPGNPVTVQVPALVSAYQEVLAVEFPAGDPVAGALVQLEESGPCGAVQVFERETNEEGLVRLPITTRATGAEGSPDFRHSFTALPTLLAVTKSGFLPGYGAVECGSASPETVIVELRTRMQGPQLVLSAGSFFTEGVEVTIKALQPAGGTLGAARTLAMHLPEASVRLSPGAYRVTFSGVGSNRLEVETTVALRPHDKLTVVCLDELVRGVTVELPQGARILRGKSLPFEMADARSRLHVRGELPSSGVHEVLVPVEPGKHSTLRIGGSLTTGLAVWPLEVRLDREFPSRILVPLDGPKLRLETRAGDLGQARPGVRLALLRSGPGAALELQTDREGVALVLGIVPGKYGTLAPGRSMEASDAHQFEITGADLAGLTSDDEWRVVTHEFEVAQGRIVGFLAGVEPGQQYSIGADRFSSDPSRPETAIAHASTIVDGQGRFFFENLPADQYRLQVYRISPGGGHERLRAVPEQTKWVVGGSESFSFSMD